MKKDILTVSVVALTLVLGFTVIALADSGALADFNAQYPKNKYANNCNICHKGSPPARNPYGTDLVKAGATAGNISAATFLAVEGLDSDGDGATNIAEINAGTWPGDPKSKPALAITMIAPTGGEVIDPASTYTVQYDAPANVSSVKVSYSLDGGVTWFPAVGTAGAGSFDWNVPTPVKSTTKALLKVIGFNASNVKIAAGKSSKFTIEVVSITAPVADEIVTKGSVYTVTWTTNVTKSPVNSAKVSYTYGSSGIWKPAKGAVTDPLASFSWNVPSPAKSKIVKLKVVLKDGSGLTVGSAISKAFIVQ
jgi:hypothetical protein